MARIDEELLISYRATAAKRSPIVRDRNERICTETYLNLTNKSNYAFAMSLLPSVLFVSVFVKWYVKSEPSVGLPREFSMLLCECVNGNMQHSTNETRLARTKNP